MIPFQLGFRNLLGILAPGAVLTIAVFACLEIRFPGTVRAISAETGFGSGPLVIVFLLVAYILGSVIRLWSADTVDKLSAILVWAPYPDRKRGSTDGRLKDLLEKVKATETKDKEDTQYFKELLGLNQTPEDEERIGEKLIRWAWTRDTFPYPAWEVMKLRLYHPEDVYGFFKESVRCFATGSRRNKEFFNFCKATIYEAHDGNRHGLSEEVQSAEANVRFYAGVFWALLLAALALVASSVSLAVQHGAPSWLYWLRPIAPFLFSVVVAIIWLFSDALHTRRGKVVKWTGRIAALSALLGIVLAFDARLPAISATESYLIRLALALLMVDFFIIADGRFRLSRLKEVDTVFDAYYLVERSSTEAAARRESVVS